MIPLSAGDAESSTTTSRASGASSSTSTAITVDLPAVAAVGQASFHGTRGIAESRAGEGSDLAQVEGLGAFVRTTGGRAEAVSRPTLSEGSTDLNALRFQLDDAASRPLFALTSLRNTARCAPPRDPRAGSSWTGATVLGTAIDPGTSKVAATGEQLGYADIGKAPLTVNLRKEATTADLSASARTIVEIGGRLYRKDGTLAYDGPLAELRLGDIDVTCAPVVAPTSTAPGSPDGSPESSGGPTAPRPGDGTASTGGAGGEATAGVGADSEDRSGSGAHGTGDSDGSAGAGRPETRQGGPGGHGRQAAAPGTAEDPRSVDPQQGAPNAAGTPGAVDGTLSGTPVRSSWPLAVLLTGIGLALAFLYWRRHSRPRHSRH